MAHNSTFFSPLLRGCMVSRPHDDDHAHLKEPSTTSRRPHQARLQIDLQNELQIDYVCNLTT